MQGVAFEGSDTDGRHQACSSLFSIIKESSFPTPQPDLPSLHVILLTLFCPPLPLFSPLDGIYRPVCISLYPPRLDPLIGCEHHAGLGISEGRVRYAG